MPAHRKRGAAVKHPRPVNAFVKFCSKVFYFLVGKILARREDAAEEDGSVDGRKLTLFPTLAGFHVNEMIEETVDVGSSVDKEAKRALDAFDDFRGFAIAAAVADAETGQAKAGGGDAGHGVGIGAFGASAV